MIRHTVLFRWTEQATGTIRSTRAMIGQFILPVAAQRVGVQYQLKDGTGPG